MPAFLVLFPLTLRETLRFPFETFFAAVLLGRSYSVNCPASLRVSVELFTLRVPVELLTLRVPVELFTLRVPVVVRPVFEVTVPRLSALCWTATLRFEPLPERSPTRLKPDDTERVL